MSKVAWEFGLALFNSKNEEIMSINEINENEKYFYVVGENLFKELKKNFLEFLKETNYEPKEVSLEEIARQITVHYVACIENEPSKEYIELITFFDTVKESAKWFFENGINKLEEYDAEI